MSQARLAPQLYFYQSTYVGKNTTQAFADTQAFLRLVGQTQRPLLHYWSTTPTIILGMRDRRLPHLAAGLAYLRKQGYAFMVRNSGGLAVVSDPGVLNISLVLPPGKTLTIAAAYQTMIDFLTPILPKTKQTWQAGEIAASYCPGDYDLSIAGQKIAGAAQRRSRGAIAIMLYLSVSGNQAKRGQLMQHFYELSGGQPPDFPEIDPNVMATLNQFTAESWTINDLTTYLNQQLTAQGYQLNQQFASLLQQPEFAAYQHQAQQHLAELNQDL